MPRIDKKIIGRSGFDRSRIKATLWLSSLSKRNANCSDVELNRCSGSMLLNSFFPPIISLSLAFCLHFVLQQFNTKLNCLTSDSAMLLACVRKSGAFPPSYDSRMNKENLAQTWVFLGKFNQNYRTKWGFRAFSFGLRNILLLSTYTGAGDRVRIWWAP